MKYHDNIRQSNSAGSGRILGLVLCAVLLSPGCANLTNIKKFATASADSGNYTTLVTDYEKSAERQKAYERPDLAAQLDKTIQTRKAQQKPMLDLLQGIQGYMNAIGSLASDQLVSYDKSLSTVSDSLKQTQLLTTNQADAFDALTKLLATAATDAYRQSKLKAFIREANPNFQSVVEAVTNIVGKEFVASLDDEETATEKYFDDVVETAKRKPPQDAAIELVTETRQQRIAEIDTKRQACAIYVQTLVTIGKGHQALYDHVDQLSSAELLSTIDSYGTSISQLLAKLKQLK